jgi:hypothetical protein
MYDELAVLPPELLPNSLESLAECIEQGRGAAREALQPLMESHWRTPDELAPIARDAFERIRAICGSPSQIELDPNETPMNRENDRALYIFRTSGVPALVLASSAVQAYVEFLDEIVTAGTDLAAADVGPIQLTFTVIFTLLGGGAPSYDLEQEVLLPVATLKAESHDPLRRWVRGHHAFMVILQWQIILFHCLRRHVEQFGGDARGCELLKLLILSMRATLQAFRFTAEFTSDAYAQLVRPTLMPPAAPAGMSGLNWRDHQYLLKGLTKLDGSFGSADDVIRGLYAMLKAELRDVYDGHKYVCSRFVGEDAVSLMSKTSAVAILERLKEQRSRLL